VFTVLSEAIGLAVLASSLNIAFKVSTIAMMLFLGYMLLARRRSLRGL
jgi:uncharacterized membrane protein SpoIIM required for sporulation